MAVKKPNNFIFKEDGVWIELRRRNQESLWTVISLEDYQKVSEFPYSWHSYYNIHNRSYYAIACERYMNDEGKMVGRTVWLEAFLLNPNKIKDVQVDHQNHDTLDNRRENLRYLNRQQNGSHRSGKNNNNTSGYRNVCWDKRKEKWIVQLQIDGKNKVLGTFDDVHEAGKFAEEKRKEIYGEFAGKN